MALFSEEFAHTGKAKYLRSTILLGKPLEGTKYVIGGSSTESTDEDTVYDNLLADMERDVFAYLGSSAPFLKTPYMAADREVQGVEVKMFSPTLYSVEFGNSANLDFTWAVFSAILVYSW